jgi:hypothetical protein
MPDVAVIMPAFIQNDEQFDWMAEALESVFAQSFTNWELIIVDDCSPVELSGPTQGQIRVIHHDRRRGAGAARNTGIAATKAPYLLCLDADDRLKPDGLQRLWDMRCPKGVVYGNLEYVGERTGSHDLPDWSLELLLRGVSPLPVTALHPRSAWRLVGGFDESLPGLEDVDYWIRLAERGVCGVHVPGVIFEYRRHSASRQAGLEANDKMRMRQVREVLQHRYRKAASDMVSVIKGCSKCPGSGGQGTGVKMELPPEVDSSNTMRLRYVGPMQGGFQARGFGTGAKYFIDGRGATIVVDRRDAEALLQRQTGGRPDFEVLQDAAPVEAAPANAPVVASAALDDPPSYLPVITDLNAKDAIGLIRNTVDAPDLAVWLAEERANDEPRKTVIAALEDRIAEVSAAAGQDG